MESSDIIPTGASKIADDYIVDLSVHPTRESTPDPLEATTETPTVQTKAAKLIQKVTGHTTLLSEFDFLRAKLKAKKFHNEHLSKTQIEEYIQLLENQTVLSAKHKTKQAIKDFEQDYYRLHCAFPEQETPAYKKLRKQLDYAKIVCSTWSTFSIN